MTDQIKTLAPRIWEEITKAQKILTCFHRSPDTDSVGACLALKIVLERLNKQVTIVYGWDPPPHNALHLPGINSVQPLTLDEINPQQYDLFLMVDMNIVIPQLKNLKTLVIDHHSGVQATEAKGLIETQVSSTCEILYWLFKLQNIALDKEIGTCLAMGLWGDLIGMRFYKFSTITSQALGELINLGVDLGQINHELHTLPNSYLKVIGQSIANSVSFFHNRVMLVTLAAKDLHPYGISEIEAKSIYKELAQFATRNQDSDIQLVITQAPQPDNYWISVRTLPTGKFSSLDIAKKFGGGGHIMSAAFPIKGSYEDVSEAVIKEIADLYPELGQP